MQTRRGLCERFGVLGRLGPFLANAHGAQGQLFEMVAAYAMFANGGERVEPTLVDLEIRTASARRSSPGQRNLRELRRPGPGHGAEGHYHRHQPRAR